MSTCTIVGEIAGTRTEPCGKDAVAIGTALCERGHTSDRVLCGHHSLVFDMFPANVFCAACDREGVETPISVSQRPIAGEDQR